jgi:GT2 family glycosyltransferase
MDLCRRLRAAGDGIRYEPAATVRHIGGASSAAGATLAIRARSRVLYARRHRGPAAAMLERAGVAVGAGTHAAAALGRPAARRGHVAALRAALSRAS